MGKGSPTYMGCLHTDEDQRCRNGPRVRWSCLPAPPPLEKRSRLPCCPPMRQPDRAECVGRSCVAPDELEERAVDLRGNRLARRMSDVVRRDGTTALDGEESPPRGDCLRRDAATRSALPTSLLPVQSSSRRPAARPALGGFRSACVTSHAGDTRRRCCSGRQARVTPHCRSSAKRKIRRRDGAHRPANREDHGRLLI